MANRHFGNLGDVWKHLALAEVIRLNPPKLYWETHAGSMSYPLIPSPARDHGINRFLAQAPADPDLADCCYLKHLRALPAQYPGSACIAIRSLGTESSYLLCDTDGASVVELKQACAGLDARVVQGDGVATILDETQKPGLSPRTVLVVIDPFDPYERVLPDAMNTVEAAGRLAALGLRVFYWYGYDELEKRAWAVRDIRQLAPSVTLWCGDVEIPAPLVYPQRRGSWGCGIVLANASPPEAKACEILGKALERRYADYDVVGNIPSKLSFSLCQ